MDIGTAKPAVQDRQGIPHHLVDVTEPDVPWSLATFQEHAQRAIAGIHQRGKLPFLVGGTGQYLRAVMYGWQPPPVEPDLQLRSVIERWSGHIGAQGLHQRLGVIDPQAAAAIDARNLRRTIRALEVIFKTGERFSRQRQAVSAPYQILQVGLTLPRTLLFQRIDRRVESMFEAGLVDEVRQLLQRGFSPALPAFSAIGYRQVIAYLEGRITLEQAAIEMKRATRVLVRRQANWFKADDPDINWFDLSTGSLEDVEDLLRAWLHRSPSINI